jgi:flagellar hook-associated protein 1 FlgK
MGGLLSALNVSSTALEAFTEAFGVSQQNVANAATAGYASQRASIRPIDDTGITGGGDTVSLSSTGSALADALVQSASSQASASQTAVAQLTPLNQACDITGSGGILAALQNFSSAFSSLSVTPNDSALRAGALSSAAGVASAFQQAATGLDQSGTRLHSQIQSTVSQINALSGQIAGLNQQGAAGAGAGAGVNASLRSALDQLSSLVDINVTSNGDGTVSVLAGGEVPLVLGNHSYTLSVDPLAAPGAQVTSSAGGSTPASFSGQLGALLQTQNSVLDPLLGTGAVAGSLNTLAAGFASRVNVLLESGTTAAGTAGVPLFSFDATNPANAARSLAVAPSFTPDQLALASGGAAGQANGIANQLAVLPGSGNAADLINGLSAQDLFSSIAAGVGQQLSDANAQSTTDQTSLTAAQTARTQQSGVSLDQEAVNVSGLQNAYSAEAKVVAIIDQLTSDAVNLLTPTAS